MRGNFARLVTLRAWRKRGAGRRQSGPAISPSRDQSSCGTVTLTILGVCARCGGWVCCAFLKCAEVACVTPASWSRNASTSTYYRGLSRNFAV